MRAEVQDDALLDLRALRLLEQLAGRAFVEELIYAEDVYKRQPLPRGRSIACAGQRQAVFARRDGAGGARPLSLIHI